MTSKQPEIRFEGFSGDWEEKRLGDIGSTVSGTGFPNNQQGGQKGIPFFKVSDMNKKGNEVSMQYANNYVSELQVQNNNWKPIETTSAIMFAKVGAAIILNRKRFIDKRFLIDNNLMIYILGNVWNKTFGLALFATINLPKYAQVGALPSYNGSDIENIRVTIPTLKEQKKIGHFFSQLDESIALQQRKIEALKEQKKGFLQKMFPKEGATVPEVRFEGFSEEWEEKKLGEVASKIGDGIHGTPKYSEDGNAFFINGNNLINGKIVITNDTKFVFESEKTKDDKALDNNTILMSINGTIGNLAYYNNENVMLGKSSAYLTISDFNKKFVYAYLQTKQVRNYFRNKLTGTTIKNLGLKTIRETDIFVPNINEQQKIGMFFKQLDDVIALNERELELLKETKKGFLQKLFV